MEDGSDPLAWARLKIAGPYINAQLYPPRYIVFRRIGAAVITRGLEFAVYVNLAGHSSGNRQLGEPSADDGRLTLQGWMPL
jgi:hypothetical protein